MQINAQKQELIRQKKAELEKLQAEAESQQVRDEDLYEEQMRQQQEQPKLYDAEQVLGIMWSENVNYILNETPLSQLKAQRLLQMRNYLLHHLDLSELIPQMPEQEPQMPVQPPVQRQNPPAAVPQQSPAAARPVQKPPTSSDTIEIPDEQDMDSVVDSMIEPEKIKKPENDLDLISKKMKAIDSPDGLLNKKEDEKPQDKGLKRFLPSFGKKKPVDRDVSENHQPTSMG